MFLPATHFHRPTGWRLACLGEPARPPPDVHDSGGQLGSRGCCRPPSSSSSCYGRRACSTRSRGTSRSPTCWSTLRTPWLDAVVRQISFLGSTRSCSSSPALAALASWRSVALGSRIAIVVIALARPADRVRAEGARQPRPARRATGWSHGDGLLVPERPPARHRRELGPAAAGGRALHAPPLDLVGGGRSRSGRSPCWSPPAGCGSACTGRPTSSRRSRSRCSAWPAAERFITRHPRLGAAAAGQAVDSKLRTSTSRWSMRPVLDAPAELAPVGLVERRHEARPRSHPVAQRPRVGRRDRSDLEAAGEQDRLHHLVEGLAVLGALDLGVEHDRRPRSRR